MRGVFKGKPPSLIDIVMFHYLYRKKQQNSCKLKLQDDT